MGYVFFAVMAGFALLLIPFSSAAFEGASEGVRIFGVSVLPSLFPFLVCSHYFTSYSDASVSRLPAKLRSVLIWAIAAVCGTPSSALLLNDLSKKGVYGRRTASALCAAFNMAGPVFILSTLSEGFLGSTAYAAAFSAAHYGPPLAAAVLSGFLIRGCIRPAASLSGHKAPLKRFSEALSGAVTTVLRIGGTIVFFRVVHCVLKSPIASLGFPHAFSGALTGLLEMTNGIQLLCASPSRMNMALCAFLLSFGGVSVFIQSKMIFEELEALPYFLTKALMGLSGFFVMWFAYPRIQTASSVFSFTGESAELVFQGSMHRLSLFACGAAAAGLTLSSCLLISRFAAKK